MWKFNIAVCVLIAAVILSACAKKAENIEPAAISTAKYDGWNCKKLARETAFVDEALVRVSASQDRAALGKGGVDDQVLVRVSASQDRAAKNDAWMVFLIGVPTSGGGIPGEVARLKGEQEAIRRSMLERDCRVG